MTGKIAGGVLAVMIVAVLLVGALGNGALVRSIPVVSQAIARQEQARARALEAAAAEAEARAAEAQTRAAAAREAQSSIVYFWRWSFVGVGGAVFIVLIGGALVLVGWMRHRSKLIYPNRAGHWPLIVHTLRGGEILLTDPMRALGPVTVIRAGDETASESTRLQIATQAQASAVMLGIASRANGDDVAKRVSKASEALPAPTFASGGAPGGLRMVYVKQGNGTSEAQRDLQDLREFIQGAGVRGLARRAWMGQHFSSGHECTRARYDELIQHCEKAGVIKHEGQTWMLSVSESEALDAFGIGAKDEQSE